MNKAVSIFFLTSLKPKRFSIILPYFVNLESWIFVVDKIGLVDGCLNKTYNIMVDSDLCKVGHSLIPRISILVLKYLNVAYVSSYITRIVTTIM